MSDEATPDTDADCADSGPFCPHWGDPSDCHVRCVREGCVHSCRRHDLYDGATCAVDGCQCLSLMIYGLPEGSTIML